jgi:hypothetical protein
MKLSKTVIGCISVLLLTLTTCNPYSNVPFRDRIQPVKPGSGFKMEGYHVWGGSVIEVEGTYHMFASRWPAHNDFPYDYFTMSEIVRATSNTIEGPYTFQEVVIGERDSSFWDANMAHNPTIHKINDTYVLFYIGSDFTTMRNERRPLRRIGYATAKDIKGPWIRSDEPVLNRESNNPAILVEDDKSVKMMFRDEKLKVFVATALSFKGPYEIRNDNVWPRAKLEDFYLFKRQGKYHMLCEDNVGDVTGHVRWGAHLISEDGIDNWKVYHDSIAYDHDVHFTDGSVLKCNRRERPQLFIENQIVTYLFTGIFDGTNAWCQPVALNPPYRIDK